MTHASTYTENWVRAPEIVFDLKPFILEMPELFEEMKIISHKLSEETPGVFADFFRTDFYCNDNKLLISELTEYKGGGTTGYSEKFDRELMEAYNNEKNRYYNLGL